MTACTPRRCPRRVLGSRTEDNRATAFRRRAVISHFGINMSPHHPYVLRTTIGAAEEFAATASRL
ncbi:hypothetical protein [Streptomyces sp. NPDC006645]|uniref:hypothetical protein n=1 Tax=unclassified Streptomyces TaxID=2593676 RepID=UPI0033AE394B